MCTKDISLYKQAVVSIAWTLKNGVRDLIFACVRLVPKYMGDEKSLPEQGVLVRGKFNRRLYYKRVVVTPEDGLSWYQTALCGKMPLLGQDQTILVLQKDMVPVGSIDNTFYTDAAPFRSRVHAGVQCCSIFPKTVREEITRFIANESVSDWLTARLLWKITENLEYLCSVNFVAPNPYFAQAHIRLLPSNQNGHEGLLLTLDRDCGGRGLEAVVQQRTMGMFGAVKRVPITGAVMTLPLVGACDEIGYSIFDLEGHVLDRQDYCSFVRKIVSTIEVMSDAVTVLDRKGEERYVYRSVNPEPTVAGDNENLPELELKNRVVRLRYARDRRLHATNQFIYYMQGDRADAQICSIIGKARKRILIIDPYFSRKTSSLYLRMIAHKVKVDILCSPKGIKNGGDGKGLLEDVQSLNKTSYDITVKVAGRKQLHDRFIVVDNECWLLGSSMQTIGDSLSAIIRLEDGEGCADRLYEFANKVPSRMLAEWVDSNITEH